MESLIYFGQSRGELAGQSSPVFQQSNVSGSANTKIFSPVSMFIIFTIFSTVYPNSKLSFCFGNKTQISLYIKPNFILFQIFLVLKNNNIEEKKINKLIIQQFRQNQDRISQNRETNPDNKIRIEQNSDRNSRIFLHLQSFITGNLY